MAILDQWFYWSGVEDNYFFYCHRNLQKAEVFFQMM